MIESKFDESKIKILREYNLRKIKPNINEIYLKLGESSLNKASLAKEFYCTDCNKLPLILYKCNHQFCRKFLCSKCLKHRKNTMESHEKPENFILFDFFECTHCDAKKFLKYDYENEKSLQGIKFFCPSKSNNHKEEILIRDIQSHIDRCEYIKYTKCLQCEMIGSEEDLNDHILSCKEAIVLCEICSRETEMKYLESHMRKCRNNLLLKEAKKEVFDMIKKTEEEKIENLSNDIYAISCNNLPNAHSSDKSLRNEDEDEKKIDFEKIFHEQKCSLCNNLSEESENIKERLTEIELKFQKRQKENEKDKMFIKDRIKNLEKKVRNMNKGNQKDKNDPKKYFVALLLFGFLLQQIMLIYYMNGSIKK